MTEIECIDGEVKMLIACQLELRKLISNLMAIYGGREPEEIAILANNLVICLQDLQKIITDKITE